MSLALHYWMRGAHHCSGPPISEMTYTVSSGTLNSTTPYHTFLLEPKVSSGALACHIPGMTLSTNSHTNYVEHGPMACFQLVELMQGCRQVTTLALYSVGSYWDQQFYSVCVCVLQGAILTTMLATSNFSSKLFILFVFLANCFKWFHPKL